MRVSTISKIPVVCINLASAKDRWDRMESRCRAEGLVVERWEADTPETLLADGVYADYLTAPQRACASSHLRLWRWFLGETDSEAIMILEDDAVFLRGWQSVVDRFLKEKDVSEWHALFLNVSEPIEPLYTWVPIRDQCLTAGYILTRDGARILLDMYKDHYFASDCMTQGLQKHGKCFSYFPWLIVQDGYTSTIQQDNTADYRKLRRILRQYGVSYRLYGVSD